MTRRSDIKHPRGQFRQFRESDNDIDAPANIVAPTGDDWRRYEETLPMFFEFGNAAGQPTRIVPFERMEGLLFHDLARLLASRIRQCDMQSWSRTASDHDVSVVYKHLTQVYGPTLRRMLLSSKDLINRVDAVTFTRDSHEEDNVAIS